MNTDILARSDDRFKSTFHRVRAPTDPETDYFGPRYSIAFFNQPTTDCIVQGPLKKYPVVTGAEFTKAAMMRNYAALEAKKELSSKTAVSVQTAEVAANA